MIIQFAPSVTRLMTKPKEPAQSEPATDEVIPSSDLRKVGLKAVGSRLSASRGDLDVVFKARAQADVVYCPVCPEPHAA